MIGKTNSQTGGARGENLNITLTSNQTDKSDLIGATVTVSYGDETVEQVWNGSVIVVKVPQYVDYTVSVSAIEGYSQPSPYIGTASNLNNSLPLTFTYNTEVVSVSLSADDNSSVNGAKVTINGKSHTWNGSAITQKVPFGTTYSVVPQALSGYSTPASQTGIVASQSSRNLSFTYIASALKVNILSNQDNDSTIAAVKATVAYGSTSVQVSNGQQVNVPADTAVTITFPEVENYKTPDPISFTHTGGLSEKSGTYKCELLTVNVTADSGTPTGFEVTISKQETVGVATKYTRLGYIESTGTQWIDTGYVAKTENYRVKCRFSISELSTTAVLFGGGASTDIISIMAQNPAKIYVGGGRIIRDTIYFTVGETHEMDCHANGGTFSMVFDGTTYSEAYTSTINKEYSLALFGNNVSGSVSAMCKARIYSFQIYDNGTLVRDYVPALRSDGIAGLYDAVNDTFTASSGTSNFIVGSKQEEVIATQTSVTGTYKIPFDTSYSVQASKVSGYTTPPSVTRVASAKSYTVSQQYALITEIDLSLQDVYGNPINRSTANCYVVRNTGTYKFPLVYGNAIKNGQINTSAFTNNGGTYSHDFVDGLGELITGPYIGSRIDELYHRNNDDDCLTDIELIEEQGVKYIRFKVLTVPETGANSIISAVHYGAVWSWHIWLWPHDLSPVEITNSTGVKYNIMPVNLASKYDSDGVHIKNWFYQWGRPMPLLCPSAWNSTTDHTPGSIAKEGRADELWEGLSNTDTFYYNGSSPYNWFGTQSYYNLWDAACTGEGNSDNDTVKTVYDPCPVGWKVPNGNTFTGLSIISSANGIVKMRRYSGDTVGVGFPLSGFRSYSDGSLYNVVSYGYVWLSSAYSQYYAYFLYFGSGNVDPQGYSYRACGFSVRPVQDDNIQLDVIMISFTIGGTSYQAESGMTWRDWVNSEYNTGGYYEKNGGISNDSFYVLDQDYHWVNPEDKIQGIQYAVETDYD